MHIKVSVKKKYKDFELDAAFETGNKRTGILGASGCGKSLTLKSIAGLVRPDEGQITFDDRVMFDHEKKIDIIPQKRKTGYLFQEYALFPNMTVRENIHAALCGVSKNWNRPEYIAKSDEMIKKTGLWEVRDHRPHEISGGQKQRCALARMLVNDPDLLLLDEPFSAMDAFLREGMRLELIKILEDCGKTAIIVSHDRDELYQMCDRLVLMDNGKVIGQGKTEDVFKNPKTTKAARLTGCKNISRIERLDKHRVRALDWNNAELVTDEEIEDTVTHIGIRAHDLIAGEHGENVIKCGQVSVSDLPFERYVTLENGLWWKLPKELFSDQAKFTVPQCISIPPDKIIPLSG
ncbi:MAG: ATP-binding cassette domain-containing protein [Lachnospiraceae bacterium]|nr:ATP-binding cassette domain-containing protein [Lachnospiraceae bacterium]